MATGEKISEMPTTDDITGAFVPVVIGGANYKAPASLFTNNFIASFANVPALEVVSDITAPYVTIACTQNAYFQLIYDCHVLNETLNNLFESDDLGTITYIGQTPCMMTIISELSAGVSGGAVCNHEIWRNLYRVAPERNSITTDFTFPVVSSRIPLQYGDKLTNFFMNVENNNDLRLVGLTMRGIFEGTLTEDEIVSDELFVNPNMTNTSGFTAGDTVLSVSAGELSITSNDANSAATANLTGLTNGAKYRIEISAKRGAQGATQTFQAFGLVYSYVVIATTSFVTYIIDTEATATTGDITLNAAIAGAAGDVIVLNYLSVKEYL